MTNNTTRNELATPWTLHFDSDGTEDIAIIRDATGEDLAATRPFWQPTGDDPVPQTLAAALAMKAAPNLLRALVGCVALLDANGLTEGDAAPVLRAAVAAINEACEWPADGQVAA